MKKIIIILLAIFIAWAGVGQNTRGFELSVDSNYTTYSPIEEMPDIVVQESPNGSVTSVKYSADGKYLAASTTSEMQIFEAETGMLLKTYTMYRSGDFSFDGKYIVYRPTKTDVEICTVATGEKRSVSNSPDISDEAAWNTHFAFTLDGRYFAIAEGHSINLYNIKTLNKEFSLNRAEIYFNAPICFSVDSVYLSFLGSSEEGKLGRISGVWDINTGEVFMHQERIITVETSVETVSFAERIYSSDISPIYQKVAYAFSNKVVIQDLKSDIEFETLWISDVISANFSSDDKFLYVLRKKYLTVFYNAAAESGGDDWQKVYEWDMPNACSLAMNSNKKVYAIGKFRAVYVKEFNTEKTVKVISGISDLVYLHKNRGNDTVFVSNSQLKIRGWFDKDFSYHSIPTKISRRAVLVAPFDGGFFFCLANNNKIYRYTIDDDKFVWITDSLGSVNEIVANSDGKMFLFRNQSNKLYLYDTNEGRIIKWGKYGFEIAYVHGLNTILSKFSPTNRFIFVNDESDYYPGTVYDTKKKKGVKFKGTVGNSTKMNSGDFSPNEEFFAGAAEKEVIIYKTSSWKKIKTFTNSYYPFFSDDGQYLGMTYYEDGWNIAVYSVSNWKLVKKIKTKNAEVKMKFINGNNSILVLDAAGILRCYSLETGKICFSTIIDTADDFLTYTPEGYFNGSEGGINKFVHLVNGMEVSELGQYAETLFRPDLVAAKLRGEDISQSENFSSLAEIVSTGEPPLVKFNNPPTTSSSRDVTVNFSVQDMGGGIGAVYLSVNGKVKQIAEGSRAFELVGGTTAQAFAADKSTLSFNPVISLSDGENVIQAFATNKAGKIESRRTVAKITWSGAESKANLYVLAVGINKYSARGVSKLNYAVPDVESISDVFNNAGKKLYGTVSVVALTDENASSYKIEQVFSKLSGTVKPDDVFVFYVSGHGTSYNGDYYFIPADFNGNISSAISKTFIMKNLQKIAAQKTLLILDTCYSGAILNESDTTAYQRLSHATGQAIIAASTDEQTAIEGYEGHGVFTYALLQGLSGKAGSSDDKNVSLLDLAAYVSKTVPKLSEQKWNYSQLPWFDIRKHDFPLVGK